MNLRHVAFTLLVLLGVPAIGFAGPVNSRSALELQGLFVGWFDEHRIPD